MRLVTAAWLGRMRYGDAHALQETLLQARMRGDIGDTLLLLEHEPVITLGRGADRSHVMISPEQRTRLGIELYDTGRGGDVTYHGPGQLVGYPIFDLANFDLGLKQYVFKIEQAIIETLLVFGIASQRLDGSTGVWLDVGTVSCRKICAIGVRSSRYVTMHGFALNVNADLDYFNHINPCGFLDKGVTSMAKELGGSVDMEVLKRRLLEAIDK